jgi:hypothetical protein
MHGAIDQVDSKLVTELQKKLHGLEISPELRAALEARVHQNPRSAGFEAELLAALNRQLAEQTVTQDDSAPSSEVHFESGLRAPQSTVKLSTQMLANLDEEEAQDVAQSHGPIDHISNELVTEVHKKFESQSSQAWNMMDSEAPGLRAPQNTTKLNADMLRSLEQDDMESIGVIDLNLVSELQQRLEFSDDYAVPLAGRLAPQPTMKFEPEMIQRLNEH